MTAAVIYFTVVIALPQGLSQKEADASISGQAIKIINELLDELLPWSEEIQTNCK